MILSGIGSGTSGIMARAALKLQGNRSATASEAAESVSFTSGMKAGSLSEASSANTAQAAASTKPASPANMMADFFVTNTMETSKYIQATLTSLDMAKQMRESIKADSFTLVDVAGGLFWEKTGTDGDDKYTKALLEKHRIDRLAKNEKEIETIEASKENLKETREDIDKAADEATQGDATANDTPAEAANAENDAEKGDGSGAAEAASDKNDGGTGSGATADGVKTAVVAPEDALLKGSRDGTGDTVVEGVERFQNASAEEAANTVVATTVAAAQEAQVAAQQVATAAAEPVGSRVNMVV